MKKVLLTPGQVYKDCSNADFEHYFTNTFLLWNLNPTKRRIFMCQGMSSGQVVGQYLTRQKEFKEKQFPFEEWWKVLDVLPPYSKMFNLNTLAAVWSPNMSKNLKKSFPISTSGIRLFGKGLADEISTQNLLASAFHEFYMFKSLPTLREVIETPPLGSSVACEGDLVLDHTKGRILFKSPELCIGTFIPSKDGVLGKIMAHGPNSLEIIVDIGKVSPDTVSMGL
jgi:hypothetical protein